MSDDHELLAQPPPPPPTGRRPASPSRRPLSATPPGGIRRPPVDTARAGRPGPRRPARGDAGARPGPRAAPPSIGRRRPLRPVSSLPATAEPGRGARPSGGRAVRGVRRRPTVRAALVVAVAAVALVAWWRADVSPARAVPVPAWRHEIVATAVSQVGRQTDPPGTYCNPYSRYWGQGADTCGSAGRSEPWCADFAAWTWRQAGVPFTYGFEPGEINAGAVSFYRWGVAHGSWHPVGSGYRPQPGDVAVYGLDVGAGTADHVAIVIHLAPGAPGPEVVNGDGDRHAFSIVEIGHDEADADTAGRPSPLAGYVAPASS